MTLHELQDRALQLPVSDRWRLVQSLLSSIQKETLLASPANQSIDSFADLDSWTQSLIGAISLSAGDLTDSYVEYLEEKYN